LGSDIQDPIRAGDFEYLMIDGSIVRLHQHGAPPKKTTGKAVGKSRGV